MSIPSHVDIEAILNDLARLGWTDFKIEIACGFSSGYVTHLRSHKIHEPAFSKAARLYNFHQGLLEHGQIAAST